MPACAHCGALFARPRRRGRPAHYCSPECRRAARTAYEERRAAHAFAGARVNPDTIRAPGLPSVADDLAASLTDADGDPAYGAPEDDRRDYLSARRAYLDALAALRRRLGMRRTARGWVMPPAVSHPCHECPIQRLPVREEVVAELERAAWTAHLRREVEASLDPVE